MSFPKEASDFVNPYGLAVHASGNNIVVSATLVDDRATEIRSDRTGSVLEHCQPATDLAERVIHGITDVQPEKLAAVVVRIVVEGGSGDVRANLLNGFLVHIGMEDERRLVRSDIIRRVVIPAISLVGSSLNERIDLSPATSGEDTRAIVGRSAVGEAGNFKVSEVVEPTVATIHTEGSDKLRRSGITDVLSDVRVSTEDVAARLRAGNQTEDGCAVLFAERVVTCTITDEDNTKLVELILRELGRRSGETDGRTIDAVVQIAIHASTSTRGRDARDVAEGVLSVVTSLNLVRELEISRAAAVIKNRLGELGELFNRLGDLVFNLEACFQIVQADARGLVALGLEVPSTIGLTKGQIRRARNATIGHVSVVNSVAGSTNIRPVVFKRAGEDTLNRDFGESDAHSLRELSNTHKTTPRAINGVTLMNVNGETVSFP